MILQNCILDVIILFSYFFSNCSTRRCKCINNTKVNKKFPCTDFCGCDSTCENTDSDSILENNDFPDDDVNFRILSFETQLYLAFVEYSLHINRSRVT